MDSMCSTIRCTNRGRGSLHIGSFEVFLERHIWKIIPQKQDRDTPKLILDQWLTRRTCWVRERSYVWKEGQYVSSLLTTTPRKNKRLRKLREQILTLRCHFMLNVDADHDRFSRKAGPCVSESQSLVGCCFIPDVVVYF